MKLSKMTKGVLATVAASSVMATGLTAFLSTAASASTTGSTAAATAHRKYSSSAPLIIWNFKLSFNPGIEAVAAAFKAKTGITVQTQIISGDAAYTQKTSAAASAHALPALYIYWAGPESGAFDGEAIQWSSILNKDPAWKNSFLPAALAGVTVSKASLQSLKAPGSTADKWQLSRSPGQIYGIPIDVGGFETILGNKSILERAGISTSKPPANMEAWMADMNKVKAKTGIPGLVFSGNEFTLYENWMATFVDYMKTGPQSFAQFMEGKQGMYPNHMDIPNFIQWLNHTGNYLPGAVNMAINTADAQFAQGRAAYDLGGSFTYSNLIAMGMNPKNIVSFRVPALANSKLPNAKVTPFPLVEANVLKGPQEAQAIEFVKFLTSQQGQILYANHASDLPAVKITNPRLLSPTLKTIDSMFSSKPSWWSENQTTEGLVGTQPWLVFQHDMELMLLGKMTAKQTAIQFDQAEAKFVQAAAKIAKGGH